MDHTNKIFNIEFQWDFCLDKLGLRGKPMPESQVRMMKQAFMAGMSQYHVLVTQDMYKLTPADIGKASDRIFNDLHAFWQKQESYGTTSIPAEKNQPTTTDGEGNQNPS